MQMSLPGVDTGFPGGRNLEERKDFDDGASDLGGVYPEQRQEGKRMAFWVVSL